MFDTQAVARSLTAANFTPAQADALTDALRVATEHGDHVTADQFKAGLAEVRTEIANLDTRLSTQIAEVRSEIGNLEARLIKWIIGTVVTTAGVTATIAGVVVGVLRLLLAE